MYLKKKKNFESSHNKNKVRVTWGSEMTPPETSCPWFPLSELGGMASNAAERQECLQRYTEHKLCSSFFIQVYTVLQHRQLHGLTVSAFSYIVRTAWPPLESFPGHDTSCRLVVTIFPKVQVTTVWQHVCALHMQHNWILTLLWSAEERRIKIMNYWTHDEAVNDCIWGLFLTSGSSLVNDIEDSQKNYWEKVSWGNLGFRE